MNCTMICITAILIVAMICGTVMFKSNLQSKDLKRIIDVFDYEDVETLESFQKLVDVVRNVGINLRKAGANENNAERD